MDRRISIKEMAPQISRWILVALLSFLLSSCSWVSSPDVDEFIEQQEVDYYEYLDIAPLREVEDRLTSAFSEQVDWGEYDGTTLAQSINAIKSEFEWLNQKIIKGDRILYYDAVVANEKVNYFWGQARKILDDISLAGAVDSDTSLIYHFVRKDIQTRLVMWNSSLELAKADIDGKIKAYDAAQLKLFIDSVKPLVGKLSFL